jgi:hypothetical protein
VTWHNKILGGARDKPRHPEHRVELEAWSVRNWTLWFDFVVLAKTIKVVCFPHHRHDIGKEDLFEAKRLEKSIVLSQPRPRYSNSKQG